MVVCSLIVCGDKERINEAIILSVINLLILLTELECECGCGLVEADGMV